VIDVTAYIPITKQEAPKMPKRVYYVFCMWSVYFSTDFDDFFVIMFLPVLFQYQFINLFIESCTCTELMAKRVKRYNIQHYNIHQGSNPRSTTLEVSMLIITPPM
jgi:hypothetical protein